MLGLIAVVAGIVGFVFGLSIKEFSFGGTLMTTGTMALIGGLLLIAMAAAIRELHRIGTILASRQAPRLPRPGEQQDPYAAGFVRPGTNASQVMPIPVAQVPPSPLHSAPVGSGQDEPLREAKVEPVAALDAALASAISADRGTTTDAAAHQTVAHHAPAHEAPAHDLPADEVAEQAEPETHPSDVDRAAAPTAEPSPTLHEPEDIPLSPHETPREETFETYIRTATVIREEQSATDSEAAAEKPDAVADDDTPGPELKPEMPSRERGRLSFDAIWPPSRRTSAHRSADSEPRSLHDEDQDVETPASEAPHIAPADEPETKWSPDHVADAERADAERADSESSDDRAEEAHAVSILKSGVVDGMGYALYSDGSIEAALPSGTVRFASINELREHLEKAE
jgi:hypothetical protein